MYCLNCANPIDGTLKFCRSCGANVSLVPQAMTGRMPEAVQDEEHWHGRHRRRGQPSIETAASRFFAGIGLMLASFAVPFSVPRGGEWWFWLLIPAFILIGKGIGEYLKVKELRRQHPSNQLPPRANYPPPIHPQPRAEELSAPTTSQLISSPGVTEHTTKHLEQSR